MLFFMALVCFSQAWLFSTELNSYSPCHLGTSHGGPSHDTRLTGTSDTVFLLILFQVLARTGPPVGLHSYIPFHPSAVVQKRRLPPFCGGGNGETFEYDACKAGVLRVGLQQVSRELLRLERQAWRRRRAT